MQLILDTEGLAIKKRNNSFLVIAGEEKRMISPVKITSIAVTADCLFSTAALRLAVAHGIPVFLLDKFGSTEAMLWSAAFSGLPELRRQQAFFDEHHDAVSWLVQLFLQKTARQHENLAWLNATRHSTGPLEEALEKVALTESAFSGCLGISLEDAKPRLMAIEAQMAKLYWAALSDCLPTVWQFEKRSRRPALDAFNALLNYGYGMTYRVVELATFTAGLDPYMGIMHSEEYQKPTLVFDLIEPLRPWVDRLVLESLLSGEVQNTFFEAKGDGMQLAKPGKAYWIPRFELWLRDKLPDEGGDQLTRRSHINRHAADFATHLKNWQAQTRNS